MAPISNLLSQHGLLCSICANLSAADIARLAATSKEIRIHVASSKPILDMLMSRAVCDGSGIATQTLLFNNQAEGGCEGSDAKPCTVCRIPVCNRCRFHFDYALDDDTEWEREEVDHWEGYHLLHGGTTNATTQIKRAFDIYWERRERYCCAACHPLVNPSNNRFQVCRCHFFDHFVGKRWLCLPCFFEEEAKLCARRDVRVTRYSRADKEYVTEGLCDCGAPAMDKSFDFCRVCNKAEGWSTIYELSILEQIRAQLG